MTDFEHLGVNAYAAGLVRSGVRYHGRHIEEIFPDIHTAGAAFADEKLGGVGGILNGFGGRLDHIHYFAEDGKKRRVSHKECVSLVKQDRPFVGVHLRVFIGDADVLGLVFGCNEYGGQSAIIEGLRTTLHAISKNRNNARDEIVLYLEHDGVKYNISQYWFSRIVESFERFGGKGGRIASILRDMGIVVPPPEVITIAG